MKNPNQNNHTQHNRKKTKLLLLIAFMAGGLLMELHAQEVPAVPGIEPGGTGAAKNATTGDGLLENGISAGGVKVRIRDIASFEGVRENQLVGFGLVTGLKGQGDSPRSELVKKMMANFLGSFDIQMKQEDLQSKNSAAVVVTAVVPPFVRSGRRLDVDVSSLLDARDLEGGILMQTNLKAANGEIYAVAQGRVVSMESEAPKTVGRVLSGALVERDVVSEFTTESGGISVLLDNPDFEMARRVEKVVRENFPHYTVRAVDAEKIEVFPPSGKYPTDGTAAGEDAVQPASEEQYSLVALSARIGALEVSPDYPARVVINRYSGVVVMGQNVRVAPVVISFRESELTIGYPLSGSEESGSSSVQFGETAEVKDVVSVLKKAGLKVDDIIEVLQTLEHAGALYGRLEIM